MTPNKAAIDWLCHSIGISASHFEIVRLQGSTSSSLFLIKASCDWASQRFVLRVLDNRDWLAAEPDLAMHEAAALEEAHKAGLRAPRIIAYSSQEVGFGAPVVLMSFVEGRIELRPADFSQWLTGLADELAAIHRHTASGFKWHFESWVDKTILAPPSWSSIPAVWERAIEIVLRPAPESRAVFIHRDYHPTNVLWQNGEVSGIVDWINACRGPAGVDVAHCRTNLALMFGVEAANRFLKFYCQVADGFSYTPYWDLDSLLNMCLPQPNFYEPWHEFGLSRLDSQLLRHRTDEYLKCVMTQA